MNHPEDWASLDPPICIWCRQGEEHHGVGRRQLKYIEKLQMMLERCHVELPTNLSLRRDIEGTLDEDWDVD